MAWFTAAALLLGGCAGPSTQRTTSDSAVSERLIQTVEHQHGPQAGARLRRWGALIEQGRSAQDAERLRLVNNFFNAARFTTDRDAWQQEDYWATPVEFLIQDAGDCEEFAIAKYLTLSRMGIPEDAMRITYVRAQTLNQPHMVLAWYPAPDAEPLILDNIEPRILPAGERPDLTPVYSFNGTTLWLARTRKEQVISGSATQLEQWQNLRRRLDEILR